MQRTCSNMERAIACHADIAKQINFSTVSKNGKQQ